MPTDKHILNAGLKKMAFALPLFFIGPALIYNAFQNQRNIWHYAVLAVGMAACIFAVLMAFKGLRMIMSSLTDD
jgi:hypothetical protein